MAYYGENLGSLDTLLDFINLPQLTNSLMEGSQVTAVLTERQQGGQVTGLKSNLTKNN